MKKTSTSRLARNLLNSLMVLAVLLSALGMPQVAHAAAVLSITPITWNVIGLDSNNVNVGPENFPIGARVCNTSLTDTASNVKSAFFFADSNDPYTGDSYINLRLGTNSAYTSNGINLAPGGCKDFYYEVKVTRNSNAYNKTRGYYITASADSPVASVSTPTPRELFVEHLISQSRNSIYDIQISTTGVLGSFTSVGPGGTMTLLLNQTYWINLVGKTATNGYEQIETFINLPNTIFQVESVNTTYTADTSPLVANPSDKLYGNGCDWENNPLSPNYRSCLSTGKDGGDITVTYKVKIIAVPSTPLTNPEPLNSLVYDFSGSSYHYNADYGVSTRYVNVVDIPIYKAFVPNTTTPGGISTLTIRIPNPSTGAISGVNFLDNLPTSPGAMVVANPANASTTGCGSPTFAPVAGAASISFYGGTIAAGATCVIKVDVTAPAVGTYTNTTNHLFIDGTTPGTGTDTGHFATADLTVATTPPVVCSDGIMAQWTVPSTTINPPDQTGGLPTTKAANVATATLSALYPTLTGIDTNHFYAGVADWTFYGFKNGNGSNQNPQPPQQANFVIETKNYSNVSWNFWMDDRNPSNGPSTILIQYNNGTGWTTLQTITPAPATGWVHYTYPTITTSTTGNTTFRITGSGANNDGSNAGLDIDDITFNGCSYTPLPTLSKSFGTDPIIVNTGISLLTFTVGNNQTSPYNSVPLTGVTFTDTLPTGLLIVNDGSHLPATSCTNGSVTAANNTTLISLTGTSNGGASMAAGTACTVSVYVKGTAVGWYDNISGYVDSFETVPNTTSTGFGHDDITVITPPVIAKAFEDFSIFTGGTTSLSFTITNPNTLPMTVVGFSDTLPAGVDVTSPSTTSQCGGTNNLTTTNANPDTIVLTGGSLAANSSCTFSVTVTGTTIGEKINTTGEVTGEVSSTSLTGNTATAVLYVEDKTPGISLLKQVSNSASGPWRDSMIIQYGQNVFYKFTIENTGEVPLNPTLTDTTFSPSCTWSNPITPLPVAISGDEFDLHISTCIVQNGTAAVGSVKNTATAQATYGGTSVSDSDDAFHQNGNFGHLPYLAYPGMNVFNEGGAFHLNGTTFFGSSEKTDDPDGWTNIPYTPKATDNGVTWTPSILWTVGNAPGNGGSVNVTVTCPGAPAQPCYMNAWIDWNKDGDFNDPGEKIFTDKQFTSSGTFPLTFNIPAGTVLDGTFYSRFRLYDQLPTNPQPYGQAISGTGPLAIPLYGEIEDPFFIINGGVVNPVTLAYFRAQRHGGSVNFEWSTATETGNAGFNLYVEQDGVKVQINTDLIATQNFDSLNRQDYSYAAEVDGNIFYFEDVSVGGETRLHGPFHLGQKYGDQLDGDTVKWGVIQQEHNKSLTSQQAALKKNMQVPAAARSNATAGANAMQLTSSLNLKVRQTGIFRVTYEMLKAAGLDLAGVPLNKLTITNRGQMVPVYVQGNSKFGPGAFIEFYGQALDTVYTDTNTYTIQVSQAPAAQMGLDNRSVSQSASLPASYSEMVVVNRQNAYAYGSPGTEAWYDTSMLAYTSPKSWDFSFQVNGLAISSAPASLDLVVWGITNWPQTPDHHLVVSLNGVQVADERFDGTSEKTYTIPLPAGVLLEGTNTLRLTLPGDTGFKYDMVNLDKFSVNFQRTFTAQNGRLTFTAMGNAFQVTNLPNANVVVYRLDQNGPVRMSKVLVNASGSTFTATFAGTGQTSTYLVTTVPSLYTPATEAVRLTADLNKPAQYLIISHPDFIAGLAPLVAARQAQGLTVSVVDVTDLYTKYTYGIFDPQAIQQYIAYAAQNLGTQYALLVGGDTYDYRNYLGRNSISFIPTLYVAAGRVKFLPSDPVYADLDHDNVPDLAIGRFPVRTTAELAMMVNKTLAYAAKDYGRTAIFVSDKFDGAVSFKNISNSMAAGIPATWAVENGSLDDTSLAIVQAGLLAAMNRGTALVTFTGHSSTTSWTATHLFDTSHAKVLTNAGRPFVVLQWGCWNTYIVDPVNNNLVQSMLFSGDRGAAAVLGSLTLADTYSEQLLGDLLTPLMSQPGVPVGQALQQAKIQLAGIKPGLADVQLGWTLMGDPALVLEP